MGGRSAKIKGSRVEREVVQIFKENGNKAERIEDRQTPFFILPERIFLELIK